MHYKILLAWLICLPLAQSQSNAFHTHTQPHIHTRFPDVPGFLTLHSDFHQHTVFSDGKVWPNIRVEEAVRDSLDAISLTEHLEYQPHREDIPHPDRNRAYELAERLARPYELIVVKGSEITRAMPPGHCNAIFIQDANKLLIKDSVEVFREARRQGAFTFWNHPNWVAQRRDGIATLTDVHRRLIRDTLLHGIEVVNENTYSDEALQIALDNNLTIMGTSDIHGLIHWQFNLAEGGHRPVTLIFARERSPEAIREALFDRRTVVWHNNLLVGREEHLLPLLQACVKVVSASYTGPTSVLKLVIENNSDVAYVLHNQSDYTFHAEADLVLLAPNGRTELEVKTRERLPRVSLPFEVMNAVTAPNQHPILTLEIEVEE